MPTYQFEAMDATGQEIKDQIDAASGKKPSEHPPMGYFVTSCQKGGGQGTRLSGKERHSFSIGGSGSKNYLALFTKRLSIHRTPASPPPADSGRAVQARQLELLGDVGDEIEGATLFLKRWEISQGFRFPLHQHDQGQRTRRRARHFSAASRRTWRRSCA